MSACCKCGHDPQAVVTATWTFYVPRTVHSGNERIHNVGGSRFSYKRERDGWAADIAVLMRAHGVTRATSKRRITLTRIIGHKQRAFDRDNLGTGLKPCLDALVRCGALVDDAPAFAEVHYAQEKAPGKLGGLRVLIEELAP